MFDQNTLALAGEALWESAILEQLALASNFHILLNYRPPRRDTAKNEYQVS